MISITYMLLLQVLLLLVGYGAYRLRLRTMFMRGTRALAVRLGETQVALEQARAEKERYYLQIAEFEKQRDGWHGLYIEQTIGHGNAQNLMMEVIDQMGRKLSEHSIKFRVPHVLHEVRAEFNEKFEQVARADAAELAQKKSTKSGSPEPVAS